MAHVNEGSHTFTCRLSTSGRNHTCLYSTAAERHRTLAATHFRFRWGQKAELAKYLGSKVKSGHTQTPERLLYLDH